MKKLYKNKKFMYFIRVLQITLWFAALIFLLWNPAIKYFEEQKAKEINYYD